MQDYLQWWALAVIYVLGCSIAIAIAAVTHSWRTNRAGRGLLPALQGEGRLVAGWQKNAFRIGFVAAVLLIWGSSRISWNISGGIVFVSALIIYGTGALICAYGMLISLSDFCPQCRRHVWFRSEDIGKTLKCPKCGTRWAAIRKQPTNDDAVDDLLSRDSR